MPLQLVCVTERACVLFAAHSRLQARFADDAEARTVADALAVDPEVRAAAAACRCGAATSCLSS